MHNDLPRWQAFICRISAGGERVKGKHDKEAVSGAQSVMEGKGRYPPEPGVVEGNRC